MKWVRAAALVYAALFLLGAYLMLRGNQGLMVALYLAVNGMVVALAIIFERGRYKPKVSGGNDWEATEEKFQDVTTGKWMVVHYNKRTGERDYVETEAPHKKP